MIATRWPEITSEDLIGLSFVGRPSVLPITTLFGHPVAAYSRGLPASVRSGIERAVCDLGYRWGVVGATVEMKRTLDERGAVRVSLSVKIEYRGGH